MIVVCLFWCATILLFVCAGCFIIPPIWLNSGIAHYSRRTQIIFTGLLVSLLVGFSLFVYARVGYAQELQEYNISPANINRNQHFKVMRPIYASLQRNLIKYDLNLPLNSDDFPIILNYAQIHSQAAAGALNLEVRKLLLGVLRHSPKQVTALNLLAVDAYKSMQYERAINYWQAILTQFSPEMHNSEVYNVLKTKIIDTRNKLVNQKATNFDPKKMNF